MKKRNLGMTFIVLALALVFAGVMVVGDSFKRVQALKKGDIKDINTVSMGQLQEDDLVQGTFDTTWGSFAEEYETTYGIRTSKDSTKLYYLIDMKDYYLIYETSISSEYTQLDMMADELYEHCETLGEEEYVFDNWKPIRSMEVTGYAKEVSDEIRGYCKDALNDLTGGAGQEEMDYVEFYMISHCNFDTMGSALYIGFGLIGVGVVVLVICIILTIRAKRRAQQDSFY
ncbi:MAG: hypothetical protein E7501_02130 [Ruminococcus sp.]|nr:hypothetical protein [Ruminococcus sp.]